MHVDAPPQLWGSLLFQVLVVSFASYLLWFSLMRRYLVSRLGAFSFLTPLLGVVLGAWILGERIERRFVLATVPVLGADAVPRRHPYENQPGVSHVAIT